jgi:hypothetical protein
MTEPAGDNTPRTEDRDGREVMFNDGARRHLVVGGRGPLLEHTELILPAVSVPDDYREDGPRTGRERFYRQNVLNPAAGSPWS